MNLVYSIIFLISTIGVIIFDWKIQKIPVSLILINYISLALLINPLLIIGVIIIFISKYLDKPIDLLYLLILSYLIIISDSVHSAIAILIVVTYIVLSNKEKLSFMVPLELAITFEIFITKEWLMW